MATKYTQTELLPETVKMLKKAVSWESSGTVLRFAPGNIAVAAFKLAMAEFEEAEDDATKARWRAAAGQLYAMDFRNYDAKGVLK